jgi:hypothetical protein
MMTRYFFILFLFVNFANAQSIDSGVWKGHVQFEVEGLPLPPKDEEDCILPHEAKNVKASIEKNLKKQGCVLTKWEVKGQSLSASLTCKNPDIDAKGSLSGKFTAKSYELQGEASGHYKEMLPATAKLTLRGQWVKACPK